MAFQLKLESVMLESVKGTASSTAVTNKQQLISHVKSHKDVHFKMFFSIGQFMFQMMNQLNY